MTYLHVLTFNFYSLLCVSGADIIGNQNLAAERRAVFSGYTAMNTSLGRFFSRHWSCWSDGASSGMGGHTKSTG
jgi:hypothetical protein